MKKSQEPTRVELEREAIDIIMRLEPDALERLLREFKATQHNGKGVEQNDPRPGQNQDEHGQRRPEYVL